MTFILTTLIVFAILVVLLLNWDWVMDFTLLLGEEIEIIREEFAHHRDDGVFIGAASRVLIPTFVLSIIIAILVTL